VENKIILNVIVEIYYHGYDVRYKYFLRKTFICHY